MNLLKIENVTKRYGDFEALKGVTLTIGPGVFGLLGPNGAGKSTLMRILTTLQTADSGEIFYNEMSWKNRLQVQKIIGYLPQKFSLYKQLTVSECLTHLSVLKGIPASSGKQQIQNVLEQVNLLEVEHKKIGQLSGGMVRRVGIAQSLLGNPALIVVDEPTAGLDPEERVRFRQILQKIGRENTVILSSHIVEDIETICKNIAVLYKGKVLIQGNLEELKEQAGQVVWSAEVSEEELRILSRQTQIVKQQFVHDKVHVRWVAERQPELAQAAPEQANLEDLYFYYMQSSETKK